MQASLYPLARLQKQKQKIGALLDWREWLAAMDSLTDRQATILQMYYGCVSQGYGKVRFIRDMYMTARSNEEREDLKWLEEYLANPANIKR